MSGYACPGCDFAHGKWSALLDHLRATDHDGGGTRRAASFRVAADAKAASTARSCRLAERAGDAAELDALVAAVGAVAPPAPAKPAKRRRKRGDDDDEAISGNSRNETAGGNSNDRVYGRGAALLRRMGWRDGEGAGRGKRGLDAETILAACMPAVSRGLRAPIGIGAPAPPKQKRAGAAEKRAKKRVKAARAAAPLDRAPAPPVVAPFDDTPRTLGRGRGRLTPAWMSEPRFRPP